MPPKNALIEGDAGEGPDKSAVVARLRTPIRETLCAGWARSAPAPARVIKPTRDVNVRRSICRSVIRGVCWFYARASCVSANNRPPIHRGALPTPDTVGDIAPQENREQERLRVDRRLRLRGRSLHRRCPAASGDLCGVKYRAAGLTSRTSAGSR